MFDDPSSGSKTTTYLAPSDSSSRGSSSCRAARRQVPDESKIVEVERFRIIRRRGHPGATGTLYSKRKNARWVIRTTKKQAGRRRVGRPTGTAAGTCTYLLFPHESAGRTRWTSGWMKSTHVRIGLRMQLLHRMVVRTRSYDDHRGARHNKSGRKERARAFQRSFRRHL